MTVPSTTTRNFPNSPTSSPPGKKMGHAGAIVSGGKGTVQGKVEALEAVGVMVANRPAGVGDMIKSALKH